jgi:hypothetical protein
LKKGEIEKIVNNLNKIKEIYTKQGFDRIYLSIIPNPVTVINPNLGNYNGLIPLIQNNKELKLELIDVYNIFKKNGKSYYLINDTHWNSKGLQTWVNEVNKKIN